MAVRISKSLSPLRSPYGVVSYRDVPLYRMQAWALELVRRKKHVTPCILSGIRNDNVIAAHNRKYGTNLHGQQYLVNLYRAGRGNPANSPQTTSHCGHADGNPVYGPAGSNIPKIKNGIDACDNATAERIVQALNDLHIHASLPYHTGSELHHFSLNPIHGERRGVRNIRRQYARMALNPKHGTQPRLHRLLRYLRRKR